MTTMQLEIIHSLDSINSNDWNALLANDNPFLKYEFLSAMERHGCLGESVGWFPCHCIAKNQNRELIGAIPAYIKTNSFGEFVFDWSWASAYEQSGLNYYPKLVSAIPFSPVTGERFLLCTDYRELITGETLKQALQQHLLEFAKEKNMSSIHWLFPNTENMNSLESQGYLRRLAYQYHWTNNHYENFEHYVSNFKSRKRKKTNREREHVKEAGIEIIIMHGNELTTAEWHEAFQFYQSTFHEKGNHPSLTKDFFMALSRSMGEHIVVVFARYQNDNIACAINFKSCDTLYGRYWGSTQQFNSLHFEVCFYQGIDYCIQKGLQRFEPGAQGEHKITRGFLPTETWSAHWIAHPQFRDAIQQFLLRETVALQEYKKELDILSPFRTLYEISD